MISARADIANGTKESITEWGFPVRVVYTSTGSGAFIDTIANGRKSSTTTTAEGLPIVSNKPYISISKNDIDIIPGKGDFVRTPADWFNPADGVYTWRAIENAPVTDKDWFIKIFLTETAQSEPTE